METASFNNLLLFIRVIGGAYLGRYCLINITLAVFVIEFM